MKPYLGVAFTWIMAAYCFYNGYSGLRFPEKYMSNPWTRPKRLINNNVEGTAAFVLLMGCLLFGFGLVTLHGILTEPSEPLLPFP